MLNKKAHISHVNSSRLSHRAAYNVCMYVESFFIFYNYKYRYFLQISFVFLSHLCMYSIYVMAHIYTHGSFIKTLVI